MKRLLESEKLELKSSTSEIKEAKIKVGLNILKSGFLVTFYRPLRWGGVEKGVENLSINERKYII